jgi:predicted RNase H-like HicB family nuclease
MESKHTIHVLALHRGEWWVAQCLEYDIATQARTLDDLLVELEQILAGYVIVGRKEGRDLFAEMPKAPKRFWDLYERARTKLEPVEPVSVSSSEEPLPVLEIRAAA